MNKLPEFLRFVLAGAANTVTTYCIYLLGLSLLPYLYAYTLAYVTGLAASYLLNSHFVFRKVPVGSSRIWSFVVVYVAQYLANFVLLWMMVGQIGVNAQIAMIIVIAVSVPTTYVALRWVFGVAERR